MARRGIQFLRGEYYHIYNRGCNKEKIFRSEENYRYLLHLLKTKSVQLNVAVIAYCLMPNHYHVLLRQDGDIPAGNLIQYTFNSYSKAFNKRYKRTGTLFEGPFKAKHIDQQEYLIHLCRYIHRNPPEAGLVDLIEKWEFSNYHEWINKRKGFPLDKAFVKNNFDTVSDYIKFVSDYTPRQTMKERIKKNICD